GFGGESCATGFISACRITDAESSRNTCPGSSIPSSPPREMEREWVCPSATASSPITADKSMSPASRAAARSLTSIFRSSSSTLIRSPSPRWRERMKEPAGRAGAPKGSLRRGPEKTRKSRWRRRRSEEHTSELQSRENLVCRLLLEKKKKNEQKQ